VQECRFVDMQGYGCVIMRNSILWVLSVHVDHVEGYENEGMWSCEVFGEGFHLPTLCGRLRKYLSMGGGFLTRVIPPHIYTTNNF
jgi:hypothetical protein